MFNSPGSRAGRKRLPLIITGDGELTLSLAANYTLTVAGNVTLTSGSHSGTNTGDQTSIVGITGTLAEFNTACSDANFQAEDAQLTSLAALSYGGNTLKVVRVNAGETDFELATISGSGLSEDEVYGRMCAAGVF